MLTLNDEQEKALREWWRWADRVANDRDKSFGRLQIDPSALYSVLAPLMKPWRVDGNDSEATVGGPDGIVIRISRREVAFPMSVAFRICNVLNGEERWS